MYVVWPVLYSDLTDSYRLDRRGRLRADVGGIYFSALWALGAAIGYLVTGYTPLLALVLVQHVEMAVQALPLLRFDGHYIVSDLIGVPDALSRVRAALAGLVPGRREPAAIRDLTPRARMLIRVYAASTLPGVVALLTLVALSVPAIVSRAADTATAGSAQLAAAVTALDPATGVTAAARILLAALPVAGLVFMAVMVGRRPVAVEVVRHVLSGVVVLYGFFYLVLGGAVTALVPGVVAGGALAALWPGAARRRPDGSACAARRMRERRGF